MYYKTSLRVLQQGSTLFSAYNYTPDWYKEAGET